MGTEIGKTIQFCDIGNQRVVPDRISPVIALVEGRKTLNVGCSGSDSLTNANPVHAQLTKSASSCVGIDIFEEGVEALKSRGLDARLGNAEDFDLIEKDFDIAVLGDLIEHVSNPGQVFDSVFSHLRPGGQVIVTTPNPFALTLMLKSILNRPYSVNSEHVTWFDPVLLSWMMQRSGFEVNEVWWTDGTRIPGLSYLLQRNPRFHSTFGLLATKPH